jgi:NADPH:quinone reductase-like Zn-dependent oxidoreductase
VKHLKVGQVSSLCDLLNILEGVVIGMNVGALAEEAVVNASLCVPKPNSLSHVHASAIFVGFATAYNG